MRWQTTSNDWANTDMHFTLCGERGSQACVIDGDTIVIAKAGKNRKIRITGYNAPELKGECHAETALAKQSRTALRDWLNQSPFAMSGGDEPPYDQYGRELRELKRGDQWLSDFMIEQGLAQESGWGFQRGGWCD
jgi:endonuclease YncB( thermonuclease family)